MANIEELKSIFTNNELGSPRFISGSEHMSSTKSGSKTCNLIAYTGGISINGGDVSYIFCVKR